MYNNEEEEEDELNYNIDKYSNDLEDNDLEDDLEDDLEEFEEDNKIKSKPKTNKKIKSKLIGKHSLTYDTIFKGERITSDTNDEESEYIIDCAINNFDINDNDLEENRNNIDNYRDIRLKEEIFKILKKIL